MTLNGAQETMSSGEQTTCSSGLLISCYHNTAVPLRSQLEE